MTTLAYALSFIPMLLLTLVVHELGHLLTARMAGAKTGGFHIGGGRRIITVHTGRTRVELGENLTNLNPGNPGLQPGDLASFYVRKQENGYRAIAVLPKNGARLPRHRWDEVRKYNQEHMRLDGKIREIDGEKVILADMEWALKALPFMAGVILPEDPERKAREAYNTMTWSRKTLLTAAGPAANILLMAAALAIAATFQLSAVGTPVLEVETVETGSPAEAAGVMLGDLVIQVGNLPYPRLENVRNETQRAARNEREVRLEIQRDGENLKLGIWPDPDSGGLGISVRVAVMEMESGYAMTPGAISKRILLMGQNYAAAIGAMVTTLGDPVERNNAISGPVMGSYQTARAVEIAGLQAWLVILATLNLGVAVTNLMPIPPLDGYRMAAESIQSLRKGKPINPKVERAMFVGGMGLVLAASLYLFLKDLNELLG